MDEDGRFELVAVADLEGRLRDDAVLRRFPVVVCPMDVASIGSGCCWQGCDARLARLVGTEELCELLALDARLPGRRADS